MGKRGPAPWRPTKEQRENVALWASCGISEPVIAQNLGICQNTLRKHCSEELSTGNEMELSKSLARLRKAADAGNVSAMKYLHEIVLRRKAAAEFQAPEPKLGKKEVARQMAGEVMTTPSEDWGSDLITVRPN